MIDWMLRKYETARNKWFWRLLAVKNTNLVYLSTSPVIPKPKVWREGVFRATPKAWNLLTTDLKLQLHCSNVTWKLSSSGLPTMISVTVFPSFSYDGELTSFSKLNLLWRNKVKWNNASITMDELVRFLPKALTIIAYYRSRSSSFDCQPFIVPLPAVKCAKFTSVRPSSQVLHSFYRPT